jgi:hypothetical protein
MSTRELAKIEKRQTVMITENGGELKLVVFNLEVFLDAATVFRNSIFSVHTSL